MYCVNTQVFVQYVQCIAFGALRVSANECSIATEGHKVQNMEAT